MPLFTYDCVACSEVFEELISFKEKASEIHCPECGSKDVQKRMSRVAQNFRPSSTQAHAPGPVCAPGGT